MINYNPWIYIETSVPKHLEILQDYSEKYTENQIQTKLRTENNKTARLWQIMYIHPKMPSCFPI